MRWGGAMAEKNQNQKDEKRILSLSEQEALAKEEIQKIIKIAKEKGRITVEEINDNLSVEIVAVAVLDSFMQSLEANGVVVTEHSEAAKSDEKEEFLSEVDDDDDEDEDEDEETEKRYHQILEEYNLYASSTVEDIKNDSSSLRKRKKPIEDDYSD